MYVLSETWLASNTHQISTTLKIPGFQLLNRSRSNKKGDDVAAYVRDNIEIKPRDDLSNLDSAVASLWFEIKRKYRNSDTLIGVFYQPNFDSSLVQCWLDKFDRILNRVFTNWYGITIITGDMNINFLKESSAVTQYKDILQSYNLTQNISKPTSKGKSVIDHITTTSECKVKVNDAIPCDEKSDLGSPYIFLNARISKFQPRFRYIRDIHSFIGDFQVLAFNIVYTMDTVDDKEDFFNKLFTDCLEQHAPLSKKKVTRSPAP